MATAIPYIALAMSVGSTVYAMTLNYDAGKQNDFGAMVNKAGTSATRDVVYGRCLTGATVLYSNVKNTDSSLRLDIFSCGIATSYIHQLYIDEVAVLGTERNYRETTDHNSLRFTSDQLINNFDKQCEVQLRTGWADGAAMNGSLPVGVPMQMAMNYSDGEWTSNMRGDYTTLVSILTKRIVEDEAIRILGDSFKVNLEVSGVPVFDPRLSNDINDKNYKNSVESKYSEAGRNPALAALDYITNTYYGMSIDFKFIDLDSFKLAANWCDDKSFKVDGQLNQGNTFAENLNSICKSAGLVPVIKNGKLKMIFEDAGVSSHHFDYNDLLKKTLKVKEQSSGEYINSVEVDYKNSDLFDEKDVFILPAITYPNAGTETYPSQVQKDGFLNQGTLKLPMVRMSGDGVNRADSQIRYFANRELKKQQHQKEITFDIDLDETDIDLFDIISIDNDEYGWVEKEFRVISFTTRFSETEYNVATITAREHSNDVYSGVEFGTLPSQKPKENKVVSAPTNLLFNQYNTGAKSGARFSWSRTYFETASSFVVEYKKSSTNRWTHLGKTEALSWDFPRLPADSYDFRVSTFSNLYGSSDFTELLNQEISSFGVLPSVTGLNSIFTGQNCIFSWKDMIDELVILPSNDDPLAPSNPKVRDYFSHYQVDVFHDSVYKKSYNTVANNFMYTFEENIENGVSRKISVDIYIVATDGTKSQLSVNSSASAENTQHKILSGFTQRGGQLSSVNLQWDLSSEADYHSTIIRRKKGAEGSYEFINVTGSFFADSLPVDDAVGTTYYYNVAARDVFDDQDINWSTEVVVKKTTIDSLLPDFHDELNDIRNPDYQSNENELIFNVSNATRDKVAGMGLYAPVDATKNSKFIVAADEFVISAGGSTEYDEERTYQVGERATLTLSEDIQRLYEAKTETTNVYPSYNPNDWELVLENTYQSAFYFNSITGKLTLNAAVINEIDAGNITTGTLDADRIQANSITGNKIKSNTTIVVGQEFDSSVITKDGRGFEVLEDVKSIFVGEDINTNNGVWYRGYADGTGLDANVFFPMGTISDINLFGNEILTLQTIDGLGAETESRQTLLVFDYSIVNKEQSIAKLALIPDTFVIHASNGSRALFHKDTTYSFLGVQPGWVADTSMFDELDLNKETKLYVFEDPNIELIEDFVRSSHPVVILNGDDSDDSEYFDDRIIVGHTDPSLANFKVDRYGVVTAKNAVIEGKIKAHSGEFSGTLTGANFVGSNINSTEMKANTFRAGTIIASKIYASDTELLADPYDNGSVIFYEDNPDIPVSVLDRVEDLSKFNLTSYESFHDWFLLPAADRSGDPEDRRAREAVIPANTFSLSMQPFDIRMNDYYRRYVPQQIKISIDLYDYVTNRKISGADGIINENGRSTFSMPVAGVVFDVDAEIDARIISSGNSDGYNNKYLFYYIKRLNVANQESSFGSVSNDSLNGYFRVSVELPRQEYEDKDGNKKYIDEIYNAEINARIFINNE